jgi:hypothetical protein
LALNLLHHVHTFNDLAKDNMLVVQPWGLQATTTIGP